VGRALQLFDEVVLAIAADSTKKSLFTLEERRGLAEKALVDFGARVRVTAFSGLLIDYVQSENYGRSCAGCGPSRTLNLNSQMALMNRKLNDSIETLFLMPRGAYTYLSSSIIKEIGRLGGDVSAFVPPWSAKRSMRKYHGEKP